MPLATRQIAHTNSF